MSAPRLPPRASSFASHASTSSATSQDAALQGAASAFAKPTTSTRASESGNRAVNAALAAAVSTGAANKPLAPQPGQGGTAGGAQNVNSGMDKQADTKSSMSVPGTYLPPHPARAQSRSPSEQAAFLAASRALPPTEDAVSSSRRAATTKRPAAPPKPQRLSSYGDGGGGDGSEAGTPTDATPIPPTTSLVDLFERKASTSTSAGRKPQPIVIKPSGDLALESPTPLRAASGISSMIRMQEEKVKELPHPEGIEVKDSLSMSQAEPTKKTESHSGRLRVSPSAVRHSTTAPVPIQSVNRSATVPAEALLPSSASVKSLPAQFNLLHPRKMTPHMTGDQLADAMVASSLASSRQQSPARQLEPPPLPSRRHRHHTLSFSRTPSPSKAPGLKKTLRQTQSSDSDTEDDEGLYPYSKRKVQKRLGKHPNKHHEGDRKRWREAVNERERKRYEGVWAANKGIYASFTVQEHALVSRSPDSQQAQDLRDSVAEQVSNLVVREVWSRSRLPETVLEMVWDLVDNKRVGRLSKEAFVVGLWLIDGHLKGKKLPVKVSDSVWRSVKGLKGIKVKK